MSENIFEGIDFGDYRDRDGYIDLIAIWADVGGPDNCAGSSYLNLVTDIHKIRSRQVAATALANASFFEGFSIHT